jgi:MFS family permease
VRYTVADQADTSERSDKAYAIAGLAGLALAMGVGRFALTPIFPLMQSEASLSIAEGAWLAAGNYLGYLVGALAAFGVSRRPSMLIRAALVVNAAATLGIGVTHTFAAWLAWRCIAGVASAFLLVFISAACVQRLAPRGRPMLIAAVFSGVGAGIFAVGGLVLALDDFGVRSSGIWLALGAVSLVLTVFVWPVFNERTDAARGVPITQRIGSDDSHGGLSLRLTASSALATSFLPRFCRSWRRVSSVTAGCSLSHGPRSVLQLLFRRSPVPTQRGTRRAWASGARARASWRSVLRSPRFFPVSRRSSRPRSASAARSW